MIDLAQILRDKKIIIKIDAPLGALPKTGRMVKIKAPVDIIDFGKFLIELYEGENMFLKKGALMPKKFTGSFNVYSRNEENEFYSISYIHTAKDEISIEQIHYQY